MKKNAKLYRMKTDEHICPFGLKAKDLLEREGYDVEDHLLRSRKETDAFKNEHNVKTTPQVFVDGSRVGGYDDLQAFLGKEADDPDAMTYAPIVSIFAVTFLCSLALSWRFQGTFMSGAVIPWFVSLTMAVLAIQKLRDLESFSNQFITYDLLGMRFIRYSYVYPFAEAAAAVGMLSGLYPLVFAPIAIFIGLEGGISVIKAVYIDRRELKCACVGGDSNVPLGFISLSENIGMLAMGSWILVRTLG